MNCQNCNNAIVGTESECPNCGTTLKPSFSSRVSAGVDKAIGPEGVAPLDARFTKVQNKVGLVVISIILAMEIGLFTFGIMHGVPFYIPFIFILPTLGIMGLTLRANRKISQIDFKNPEQNYVKELDKSFYNAKVSAKPGTNLFGEEKIQLDPGESIITYLSPIYRFQANYTGPSMVSVERFTENVIALTDRRVLFFTVSLPGQGMLINGVSQDFLNDELKRNTIKGTVSERIKELEAGNSIDHFPNDFWIDRSSLSQVMYLKGVGPVKHIYAGAVGFRPTGGKKLKYQVVDATNFDDLVRELGAVKKLAF